MAVWQVLRDAARPFRRRGGRLLSGAIAFHALLSIVPMLIVALQVASHLTDERASRDRLVVEMARWVGQGGMEAPSAGSRRSSAHVSFYGASITCVQHASKPVGGVTR